MKSPGKTLAYQMKVENVLLRLTPQYDIIVVIIKETKDLEIMKMEDL